MQARGDERAAGFLGDQGELIVWLGSRFRLDEHLEVEVAGNAGEVDLFVSSLEHKHQLWISCLDRFC